MFLCFAIAQVWAHQVIEREQDSTWRWFGQELDKAGKTVKSIRLYLPDLSNVKDKKDILGSQICSGSRASEFGLDGDSWGLNDADGVFGVSE